MSDQPAILGGTPACPHGPPTWPPADPELAEVLQRLAADRSWGRYHGPHGERLRERLADRHDAQHVHLCASGTSAGELALRGLDIKPGDEVLLAAFDFKSNLANVIAVGAVPVLIDVRPDDAQFSVERVHEAASDRTRAVIVSHLYGEAVDMPRLRTVADRRGWGIIEDACQTPLAPIHGRPAGMWGDVGTLSFGGSKLLTAGRGGALVTNRNDIVSRVRLFTGRGNDLSPLSEMQAAILLPQLNQLAARHARREAAANSLARGLCRHPGLMPLPGRHHAAREHSADSTAESSPHGPGITKLGFWYEPGGFGGLDREQFVRAMQAEGCAFSTGFAALHRSHARRRYRAAGSLTEADRAHAGLVTMHHPVLLEEPSAFSEVIFGVEKVRQAARAIAAALPPHPALLAGE